MYRRDRDIDAAAYRADRYGWEPDDRDWDDDRDARRPRGGSSGGSSR